MNHWIGVAAGLIAIAMAAGCAAPPPLPQTDVSALERRIEALERRVRQLESRPLPPVHTFPAAPLQAPSQQGVPSLGDLDRLRERRRLLLEKYTGRHPDIMDLELEIRRLEAGLPKYEPPLRDLPLPLPAP